MRPLNCEVSDVAAVWGAPGVLRVGLDGDDPPETVGDVDYVIDLDDGRIVLAACWSMMFDDALVGRLLLRSAGLRAECIQWVAQGRIRREESPEVAHGVS